MTANDTINVALIGCRNMGWADLCAMLQNPGVQLVALCDVDQSVLDARTADAEKNWGRRPDQYRDYRRVLERKDVDAVIIGTPDHWHCLIMTDACAAGKDVYVEKPAANSIGECDAMVRAQQHYGRIVQVGQQKHSAEHWKQLHEFIASGKLGHIGRVRIWANFTYVVLTNPTPDAEPPATLDYDMWLGPAPQRAYSQTRNRSWRCFWDYGGGLMTDMGPHLLDMALWHMNVTEMPRRVSAVGGNFVNPDNKAETFDTLDVLYELPDFNIEWSNTAISQGPYGSVNGLEFKGENGMLVTNYNWWEVIPQSGRIEPMKVMATPGEHVVHTGNFLDCVRSRRADLLACPITHGALCAKYAHLGNIAARTGLSLSYDDQRHTFHNKVADRLITRPYRKPWKMFG
ncbi:MAG: Gfo/Idh/MocA family oxidoreductase [Bacteroidaceae bacterium]|nr:Gfo/Idh/MocA family oxidoreductase [Bacteroidaceae bacterium]